MAHNNSYPAYTPGVVREDKYDCFYWPYGKEEEEGKEINSHLLCTRELTPQEETRDLIEQELQNHQNHQELSPRTSCSGTLSHFTPDSATSPNSESPSDTQEEDKENEEKKSKTRIAFTTLQLRILQKLFSKQMYLSPPQIKEAGDKLGLTYKQVKTWFQNQRMKLKRTQKEKIWMKNGMCPPQNFYMDINPGYYPGYAYGEKTPSYYPGYACGEKNFPMWASAHEGYASSPSSGQVMNSNSDPNQIYGNAQNFNPFATAEEWDGNLFGRHAGAYFIGQQVGYITQQRMYHTVKMEIDDSFSNVSATATAFPSQPSTSTAFPSQPSTSTAFPSQPSTSTAFPSQLAAFPSQPSTSRAFPSQPSTSTAFPSPPAAFPSPPAAFPSPPATFPSPPANATAFSSQPAFQHYQSPSQIPGEQSHFDNA